LPAGFGLGETRRLYRISSIRILAIVYEVSWHSIIRPYAH
tara:strand:+ start:514 stop:633 length:120 start_codon:yes stop_codon:yes gene_type:complete